MTDESIIRKLLTAICPKIDAGLHEVSALRRLSGGASQETWKFTASGVSGETDFILRRSPGGAERVLDGQGIGLATEADIIRSAREAGTLAPAVPYVCTPDDGLGPAYVMTFLEGETLAPRILKREDLASARNKLARDCGKALAAIHSTPTSTLPDLPFSDALAQLDQYDAIYQSFGATRPVFDLAFTYLRTHAPAWKERKLVHGDFRNGNILVDETGLKAVLDWERSHFGDPAEDLGWICVNSWRFGRSHKMVGGFGDLEDLLSAYEDAGGVPIDPARVHYWTMLGSLKWGIMCMMMYGAYASGSDKSVERAAIGRRASETEIDLLNILEAANA